MLDLLHECLRAVVAWDPRFRGFGLGIWGLEELRAYGLPCGEDVQNHHHHMGASENDLHTAQNNAIPLQSLYLNHLSGP